MLPNTLQTWEKSTRKNNIDVQIVPKWKSRKLLACIHAVSFSFHVLDRRPYFTSSEFIYSFYSWAGEGREEVIWRCLKSSSSIRLCSLERTVTPAEHSKWKCVKIGATWVLLLLCITLILKEVLVGCASENSSHIFCSLSSSSLSLLQSSKNVILTLTDGKIVLVLS